MYLSLICSRGDLEQELPVTGIRCKLGQLAEDVGAWARRDVHVVGQGSAVGGGTGKWMHLGGLL